MPTVLLVRHGRTAANASGLLAGWTAGVELDAEGLRQAQGTGARIAALGLTIARVVSSPLQRCVETAGVIAAACEPGPGGPSVETDERLGECRYGAWTGRALAELAAEDLWRVVQDQPSAARFPDGADFPGESIAAMQARALDVIRSVDGEVAAAHGPHALWVAVSHGDVIKSILADAAGAHLDAFQRMHVDPASVSVVRYTPRRPFVLKVNDTGGGLGGIIPPPHPIPSPDAEGGAGDLEGDAAVGGGPGPASG